MVVSLRSEIEKSYEAYPRCSRASWVLQWAGQVMLCAAMIHWTEEVEKMLRLEQAEKLREYHKRLQVRLIWLLLKYVFITILKLKID